MSVVAPSTTFTPLGRLAGRRVVITGAGAGIGLGIARCMAAEGARIVIADLDPVAESVAADLAAEFGVEVVHARVDIATEDGAQAMVRACVERWGGIDVLVNNAWAGAHVGRVEHKSAALFDRSFALGFYGPFWAMQAAFPHMRDAGHGRVINLCTLNGVNALMGTLDYNAAKESLRTLTRTAAREWAPTGIVVNALCPAAKSTGFRRMMETHPELETAADGANPMGRIGDCEHDIGPVAVFLASDECQYMTGNTLFVDGGGHINGVVWDPGFDD